MKDKSSEVELGTVQETLVLPLFVRAMETQKEKPLLTDSKAVSLVNSISYDFTFMEKAYRSFLNRLMFNATIGRYIYFDDRLTAFIDSFPEATIINIGCGLDTTFYRVDNGKIQWIDLDLPDVIDLRKECFSESERNRIISKSVFDVSWYNSIENKDHLMLLMAGVLFYFNESQVKRLFKDFQTYLPGAEMIFDTVSKLSVKMFNREAKKSNKSARMIWSISNINEIEKWNCGLEVIECISAVKVRRQHYPLIERIAMSVLEAFKLRSDVAHVKIHS